MPGRVRCWLLILLATSGCAEGIGVADFDANPVYITGVVTYRGRPVAFGQIVFTADPDFGAGSDLMAASLGQDGSFVLHDGKQTGLKPGYYRLTISSPTPLPRRYYDPHASGLKCLVEPNQPLKLLIELQ